MPKKHGVFRPQSFTIYYKSGSEKTSENVAIISAARTKPVFPTMGTPQKSCHLKYRRTARYSTIRTNGLRINHTPHNSVHHTPFKSPHNTAFCIHFTAFTIYLLLAFHLILKYLAFRHLLLPPFILYILLLKNNYMAYRIRMKHEDGSDPSNDGSFNEADVVDNSTIQCCGQQKR